MSNYTYIKNAIKRKQRNIKRFENFKRWFKLFPVFYSLLLIIGTIIIISAIVWLFANLEWFELKSKNELGDAFGGLTNPIIAFIGVIVTFLAFYIQYKFNREQSKLIQLQRRERDEDRKQRDIELKKENFDKKFYELLKIHIENVKELSIENKYTGRVCFPQILSELKIIFNLVSNNTNLTDLKELTVHSYVLLYYGIKSKNVERKFCYYPDVIKLVNSFNTDINYLKQTISTNHPKFLKEKYNLDEIIYTDFELFNGHQFRLNYYFRHLFFIFESIDNSYFLDNDEKQDYFNIVRAQLSNYEQALIYYNSTSLYAEKYKKFIVEYSIIKNITMEICDFGIQPQEFFKDDIDLKRKEKLSFFSFVR